jgi:hypothetical protein
MKYKKIKILLLLMISLSSILSVNAMIQVDSCIPSSEFAVTAEPQTWNISVQSIPELEFSFETILTITPNSDITIARIDFGVTPSPNFRIQSLTDNRIQSNNYFFNVKARFSDSAEKTSSVGHTIAINGIAARIMYNQNGELKRANVCLPTFNVKITGSASDAPKELQDRLDSVESKIDIAEKIQMLLAGANVIFGMTCDAAKGEMNILETQFTSECGGISSELARIIADGEDIKTVCSEDDEDNPLHETNCESCITLYNQYNEALTKKNSACYRLTCEDMFSFDYFKSTFAGDILGINHCSADSLNEDKCKEQYLLYEKPKCWTGDPLLLSTQAESPSTVFNPIGFFGGDFCSDKKDPITTIKSPSNDLFSSLTCGCLPGLMGWADLWIKALKMEESCLKGQANRNLNECSSSLYSFSCDMVMNAFTCGGINFGVHSESARFLFNPQSGASIDISQMSPQQIREHINNGFIIMLNGQASFDAAELIHSVCSSAFGDAEIDWASTIMNSFSGSTGSAVALCPTGRELDGPCYCGSDLSTMPTNNCRLTPDSALKYCKISSDNARGECVDAARVQVPPVPPTLGDIDPYSPINNVDGTPIDIDPLPPVRNRNLENIEEIRDDYVQTAPLHDPMYYYNLLPNSPVTVSTCNQNNNGVFIIPLSGPPITLHNKGYDSSAAMEDYYKCTHSTELIRIRILSPYYEEFYYKMPDNKPTNVGIINCIEFNGGVTLIMARIDPLGADYVGRQVNLNIMNRGPDSSRSMKSQLFYCSDSLGNQRTPGSHITKQFV